MVWSHSPVVELLGTIASAYEPLCTGEVTTVSPLLQVQPLRLPVSKPPFVTRFPPVGVGVGVRVGVGVGVGVFVGVGVGVGVRVGVGVGVGVPPPELPGSPFVTS